VGLCGGTTKYLGQSAGEVAEELHPKSESVAYEMAVRAATRPIAHRPSAIFPNVSVGALDPNANVGDVAEADGRRALQPSEFSDGVELVVALTFELQQAETVAERIVQQREAAVGMLTRRSLQHGAGS
jgi:hypothetical protein